MSLTSKEIDARQEVLNDLEEYINKCQEDITAMMDQLEWTPEHFMMPRKLSQCPFNKDHKMPESSLEKHKQLCEYRSQGYSREDIEQIVKESSYFYEKADCVYTVKLDKEMLNSILWKYHVDNHSVFYGFERMPKTPVEEEQLLSRADRLGLSEHIVAMAKEAHRLKDLEKSGLLGAENLADLIKKEDKDTKLNPIEEIAALRDYRRRRQTYRAKNVHITKKSHTEILREVINNQMEIYAKSLQPESSVPQKDERISYNQSEMSGLKHRKSRSRSREGQKRKRSRSKEKREKKSRSRSRSKQRDERKNRSRSKSKQRDKRKDRSRSRSKQRDERKNRSRSRSKQRDDTRSRSRRSRSRSRDQKPRELQDRKSRSPSRSSNRHKKHKHKKHKKHKHKHGDEDTDISVKEERDSE